MKRSVSHLVTIFMLGLGMFLLSHAQQLSAKEPGSYEYKILLKTDNFISLEEGIKGFKNSIPKTLVTFKNKEKIKHRIVTYLDTEDHLLKTNHFIFRKRFTLKKEIPEELKVTLKFRGIDINTVGQNEFLAHPSLSLQKPKFEVDIVSNPITSKIEEKFSRSANIELGKFDTLSDLMVIYPVLTGIGVNDFTIDPNKKLKRVRDFIAYETVVKLGLKHFSEDSCKKASFSFWYKTREKVKPVVAEFSYVCKKKTDEANLLFQTILNLGKWVNSKSCTKTSYAYFGEFCAVK